MFANARSIPAATKPKAGFFRLAGMSLAAAAVGAAVCVAPLAARAESDDRCGEAAHHPDCDIHNMMLVGTKAAYLSHLPMFGAAHRFQVIFEATFDDGGDDVGSLYTDDRQAHPEIGMYTVTPGGQFVLSRLFDADAASRLTSFPGTAFRNHFEREGSEPIDGLGDIDVDVVRVIYARELPADGEKPDELRYILFGDGDELFLAHQIARAPDFDQIVAVAFDDRRFTAEELQAGVVVSVPERENSAATRLRADDAVQAEAHVGDAGEPATLRLRVLAEPYFEEGELLVKPVFEPTSLEIEAGFDRKMK